MALRILHTSDLHLGMRCSRYGEAAGQLREARFRTLDRLVAMAAEEKCDLLLVAGDLFNKVTIEKRDIRRAAESLAGFSEGLVLVLPGNHDYISRGQNDLWEDFRGYAGDNTILLAEEEPYPLGQYGVDATVYPAPCDSKHSSENRLGWMRGLPLEDAAHHIGVAHGSLEGVSPDLDKSYFPMSERELREIGLDLWLLGHTHIQYPEKPGAADRIFFASTPEPDGFDCHHEGKAWIIDLDDQGSVTPRSLSVGEHSFITREAEVSCSADLERLVSDYSSGEQASSLLKLVLTGRMPKDDFLKIPELRQQLEGAVLFLRMDDGGLTEIITGADIDNEFAADSFPHTLLKSLAGDGDDEALQVAYQMLEEQRR